MLKASDLKVGDRLRVIEEKLGASHGYRVGDEIVVDEVGFGYVCCERGNRYSDHDTLRRMAKVVKEEVTGEEYAEMIDEANAEEPDDADPSQPYDDQVRAIVDEAYWLGVEHGRTTLLLEQSLEALLEARDA